MIDDVVAFGRDRFVTILSQKAQEGEGLFQGFWQPFFAEILCNWPEF
jgi:hypothetical protein